ncbi:hypothetical protein N825_30145 [Skermanella stibiiresistens SB22]|uniref:Uncharacterized protein n=1 Tax=Skermanella stibiiresistens SB22 TaxID=1385369 RepID=W9GQK7_9PROT|nr:hypothetical protein [Skermanella stibiiresistens]EWY36069.1 hypothetical protein N825_30145 [Skermanella stibiiresistens SB22]
MKFDTIGVLDETKLEMPTLTVPTSLGELTTTTTDAVSVGQQAWDRIKANGKMMREDWRLVGEALLVGRNKFTTATGGLYNKGFGQWCRESGFSDIDASVRSNAMWMVESWNSILQSLQDRADLCRPTTIRAAYNELTADTPEPTTSPALPEPVKAADPVEQGDDETPPWDDEPVSVSASPVPDATDEEEGDARQSGWEDLNKLRNTEQEQVWERVGCLIGIKAPKSGDFFIENFLKSIEADYFVAAARDAMVERLKQHDDVDTAVHAGAEALRAAEDALVEKIRQAVEDVSMTAMTSYLTQVGNNKVLSGGNLNKKLLAMALDERANPNERITAADKLTTRYQFPLSLD